MTHFSEHYHFDKLSVTTIPFTNTLQSDTKVFIPLTETLRRVTEVVRSDTKVVRSDTLSLIPVCISARTDLISHIRDNLSARRVKISLRTDSLSLRSDTLSARTTSGWGRPHLYMGYPPLPTRGYCTKKARLVRIFFLVFLLF